MDDYGEIKQTYRLPKAFIFRRLQSLSGFFLILFLIEHLLSNSQAALFIGDDGIGFIRAANFLHSLPYLPIIEITLLGFPIVVHTLWGICYIWESKPNSYPSDGSSPSLTAYPKNHAYTWQRLTAILLVFGIIYHVVSMRFMNLPQSAKYEYESKYIVHVEEDNGLATLAPRLNLWVLNEEAIYDQIRKLELLEAGNELPASALRLQDYRIQQEWIEDLQKRPLQQGQVIIAAPNFGTALLMIVRDTFKSVPTAIFYSIFVIVAAFHACNGLWTFCISWGIARSEKSQSLIRKISNGLMTLLIFLGMAAIWCTYWINLKQ